MSSTLAISEAQARAQKRADQMASKYNEEHYVVFEDGRFWIARLTDMDTFFAGLSPVYCTSDGPTQ